MSGSPGRGLDERGGMGKTAAMFLNFFTSLRDAQVPVTLREYLTLMEALNADLAEQSIDQFSIICRAPLW